MPLGPDTSKKRKKRNSPTPREEGTRGIRVPAESLRHCEESFKAAQESIAKANTGHHDVTAAMALLCRHDIPLFWVNMTTAGEKQYYAVALVEELMANLPADWRVGLLYDIACQLHLSAAKHGFFDAYLDRLHFAVSVFHAFGHDWPCQLIYHPRKCIGFGLSDGESCERFWYSISKLIPYLRVAGYHLRMYTLNAQFAFATKETIANLASWLNRKISNTRDKRREAHLMIEEAGEVAKDEGFIRDQWAAQVREQTKPMPKQGKDLGEKGIQAALELCNELAKADEIVKKLRAESGDRELDLEEESELRSAEAKQLAAKVRYERKAAELGVRGQAKLARLVKSKILSRRANGLVLLRRTQVGIMKRKMEVERVVRSHRSKNGETKLCKHIKTAAERREGTIKSIVSKYNKVCRELAAQIRREVSRKGHCAVRPLKELPKTGIWDLDVDNPCWDDLRFDGDATDAAPRWMSDENTRKAIRARLILDRCQEEDARLEHERANVLNWLESEWLALRDAKRAALGVPDAPALLHQLCERERQLLRMAALWQRQGLPARGPPQAQLEAANIEWMNASCDPVQLEGVTTASGEEEEEEGPGVGGEVDDEVDEDEELVEAVEDVVAALGNPAGEGSDAEGSDSSGGSGVGGWASSRTSATGSSDGEGDTLPFVAGPDSSSDEEGSS